MLKVNPRLAGRMRGKITLFGKKIEALKKQQVCPLGRVTCIRLTCLPWSRKCVV
jgi:hypothetical protein